ncbi:MAG: hypothetical protein K9M75_05905 [Phycisphaerae bacterium]|nr:hypothetical protein [Phycisphaerae bacterium]
MFVEDIIREPLKIHFGGQANLFDSGRRQKKQALASAKPDFSSLPEVENLLLAAQKQLLEPPIIFALRFLIYQLEHLPTLLNSNSYYVYLFEKSGFFVDEFPFRIYNRLCFNGLPVFFCLR